MILYVEWIPYMSAYRLFKKDSPQDTIAYVSKLDDIFASALENGYKDIIVVERN